MSDSNWTLRMPRTSREAYGHQIGFDRPHPDKWVLGVMVVALAFIAGLLVGGA